MTATRLLMTVTAAAALCAGCQSNNQEPTTETREPTITVERLNEIRTTYVSANPNARVGWVNATIADQNLASVTEVPVADFAVGDTVSFMDASEQVIANGRVVAIVGDAIHVRYQPDARAPEVGDLALKFMRQ